MRAPVPAKKATKFSDPEDDRAHVIGELLSLLILFIPNSWPSCLALIGSFVPAGDSNFSQDGSLLPPANETISGERQYGFFD